VQAAFNGKLLPGLVEAFISNFEMIMKYDREGKQEGNEIIDLVDIVECLTKWVIKFRGCLLAGLLIIIKSCRTVSLIGIII
jgi:hypothetical protein